MAGRVVHWASTDGSTAEVEQGPVTKYTRYYWAHLDSVDTDPNVIFEYKHCPKLGSKHTANEGALVTRVRLSQENDTAVYKAEVEWSTNAGDANNEPDPLKRPAIIDITTEIEEAETFRDGKGRIRINTAGDIQVGTTYKAIQTISIQKNVPTVPKWFHEFPGSVNKSSVEIDGITYKPRTLLLGASARPNRILENKKWYYPITFQLRHDKETHDIFEPSMGFHELVPSLTPAQVSANKEQGLPADVVYIKKRITLPPGDPAADPQYLDKDGRHILLEPDKVRGGLDTSRIYIIRRNDYREEDLNQLPRK